MSAPSRIRLPHRSPSLAQADRRTKTRNRRCHSPIRHSTQCHRCDRRPRGTEGRDAWSWNPWTQRQRRCEWRSSSWTSGQPKVTRGSFVTTYKPCYRVTLTGASKQNLNQPVFLVAVGPGLNSRHGKPTYYAVVEGVDRSSLAPVLMRVPVANLDVAAPLLCVPADAERLTSYLKSLPVPCNLQGKVSSSSRTMRNPSPCRTLRTRNFTNCPRSRRVQICAPRSRSRPRVHRLRRRGSTARSRAACGGQGWQRCRDGGRQFCRSSTD